MSKLRNLLESPELKKLAQRERLKELINLVDQQANGNDPDLLQQHIAEVLDTWDTRMDEAINCYQNVLTSQTSKPKGA